jgi:hypothetical protein
MAAIDRLVHHATILEFTGESIRANAAKNGRVNPDNLHKRWRSEIDATGTSKAPAQPRIARARSVAPDAYRGTNIGHCSFAQAPIDSKFGGPGWGTFA